MPSLPCAAQPFTETAWLNTVCAQVHQVFGTEFLPVLNRLDAQHRLNDPNLSVLLELVIDAEQGCLQQIGVLRSSGVTAFDVFALESVRRALPFQAFAGAAGLVDGGIYVHWEFRRDTDPTDSACLLYAFVAPKNSDAPP